MAMPAVNRRWTAREVRQLIADNPRLDPRYELVDGELLVTPSPGRWHQIAVLNLAALLLDYLKRNPIGKVLASPSDVELEPEFLSQPDVYVVPMREWKRMGDEHVVREIVLAVEVLSPSSGRHDRVRKRPKYQRHAPEYWIMDLDSRLFERWLPGDTRPEVITERLEWLPEGATATFALEVGPFFSNVFDVGEDA
jgi:Uma2 family endonuclease